MGVQMHRATDKANAFVEEAEVEMWRGYGFAVVDEKGPDTDLEPTDEVPADDKAGDEKPKRRAKKPTPAA